MALMGIGLLDLSTAGVHTAYPPLALAVAIMGAGMGLVMAPASTTIMTTVPARQAGAGSAINDTIREVGGALGIAIVGSLAAAVYRSQLTHVLTARHAPALDAHVATNSVAAADAAGQQAGGASGSELVAAAHSAFVNAMAMGVRVAAGVALISPAAASRRPPRSPRSPRSPGWPPKRYSRPPDSTLTAEARTGRYTDRVRRLAHRDTAPGGAQAPTSSGTGDRDAERGQRLAPGGEVLQDSRTPGVADEFAHPGQRTG